MTTDRVACQQSDRSRLHRMRVEYREMKRQERLATRAAYEVIHTAVCHRDCGIVYGTFRQILAHEHGVYFLPSAVISREELRR